jgi:hypothetical protein
MGDERNVSPQPYRTAGYEKPREKRCQCSRGRTAKTVGVDLARTRYSRAAKNRSSVEYATVPDAKCVSDFPALKLNASRPKVALSHL